MSHHKLDARRLLCPMPVIKTQNKVKELSVGDILDVICTDPGAMSDIPTWARINGHEVIETAEKEGEIIITVAIKS
jgi:tRNA 2-thiouridine synthesizing protein A